MSKTATVILDGNIYEGIIGDRIKEFFNVKSEKAAQNGNVKLTVEDDSIIEHNQEEPPLYKLKVNLPANSKEHFTFEPK